MSRDAKISREPEKVFSAIASLKLKSTGERGELLTCTPKSTHPDARKHLDMAAAISSQKPMYKHYSIYNDPLARAIHDDTCRELKREQ